MVSVCQFMPMVVSAILCLSPAYGLEMSKATAFRNSVLMDGSSALAELDTSGGDNFGYSCHVDTLCVGPTMWHVADASEFAVELLIVSFIMAACLWCRRTMYKKA